MATMYIDKPMKGHNLMQAIARVNRVYKDKEAGLDWDKKASARAYMRTQVKHLLRKYKYPPEQAKSAIETVIKQAELMSANIEV